MEFLNISSNPITLAGIYTIPAAGTLEIPYSAIENDRTVIGFIDAHQLLVVDAEESFTFASIPRFTQGQLLASLALTAGETNYTPLVTGSTDPITLWVAPFQNVRLYLNVTSGDATVTIQDSPDGGTTFYPVPDAPTVQASYTDANSGKTSVLLPSGLCLIQPLLSSVGGATLTISYTRQT